MNFPKNPPRISLPPIPRPLARIVTPAAAFELVDGWEPLEDNDVVAVDDSDERPTLIPGR